MPKGYTVHRKRSTNGLLCVSGSSLPGLFATPWTLAHQAPLSMGFSRQGYWSGLPFPSPEHLPDPGIEPWSPALQADSLLSQFSSVQLLSHVRLFAAPQTAAQWLPCPSLSPGVCSTSCPLNRWCYLAISSSAAAFSFCPQSFPASESFPVS